MKIKVFDIAYVFDTSKAKPQPDEVINAMLYAKPDEQLGLWLYAVEKVATQISPDAKWAVWYTWGHKTNMTVGGHGAGIWYVHSRRCTQMIDAWFEFTECPALNLMFKLAWDGAQTDD